MHNADLELQYIPKKTVLVVIQYTIGKKEDTIIQTSYNLTTREVSMTIYLSMKKGEGSRTPSKSALKEDIYRPLQHQPKQMIQAVQFLLA